MKKLLRVSLLALLICGGYAAFSSESSALSAPQLPVPRPQCPQGR